MTAMDGIIILDKPAGISSHDAVQRLRRVSGIKRVGHLGTLDPLGTGVLPMVLGRATRLSRFFLNHDRAYEATLRFGFATDTYDRDGKASTEAVDVELDADTLEPLLDEFRGKFEQMPPAVSAKKIDGVPAYKRARNNEVVELDPVEVDIYELTLLSVEGPLARVRVRCSAGTYVRRWRTIWAFGSGRGRTLKACGVRRWVTSRSSRHTLSMSSPPSNRRGVLKRL